jgi:hypothetical protein
MVERCCAGPRQIQVGERNDEHRRLVAGGHCDVACGHRAAGRPRHGDGADEPVATARHRPNQPLARAAVADRLTDRGDPAAQRGLRHQAAAPHRAQHIVAGHDAVPVLQKIKQNVEHLALKRGALAGSHEFTPLGIKSVGPEPEDHLSLPRQGAEKKSGQSQQKSRLSQGHRRSPGLVL